MESAQPVATVIRVTRPDTIMVRVPVPHTQSHAALYLTLFGVSCNDDAAREICDWVEVHADRGVLTLVTLEWIRDAYGRVVGDLADIQSGETLSGWLIQRGVASERPGHFEELLNQGLFSEEPESEP